MQIKEFLENVVNQIKYKPIRAEISKEMENHLIEAKENYISEGMTENRAEEEAIRQMGNAEEIGRKLNKIHRPQLDWKLLLLTIILIIFGGLVTFTRDSTCYYYMGAVPYDASMFQYIVTLFVGATLSIGVYFLDYQKILKMSNYLYGLATVLMIFLLNFGVYVNGTISYISFGGFNIYAPIIAVLLYILAFVGFLQKIDKSKNVKINFLAEKSIQINRHIVKIIFLSGISLLFFSMIPSVSMMFILAIVYLIIATVKILEQKEKRKMYVGMLWGIPILIGFLFIIFVRPLTFDRIMLSFQPEKEPRAGGWVGMNQKTILESANLFGEADDMSNALTMFDEGTNFAFISILAHYGWIVSVSMVIAIVAFSIKLMINAVKIKDMYGKLIIVGISSLFILQSVFNLLMNLNLGIKSNVNLPFISHGRTDLMMNMIALSLVLSVYRRKDILIYSKKPISEN